MKLDGQPGGARVETGRVHSETNENSCRVQAESIMIYSIWGDRSLQTAGWRTGGSLSGDRKEFSAPSRGQGFGPRHRGRAGCAFEGSTERSSLPAEVEMIQPLNACDIVKASVMSQVLSICYLSPAFIKRVWTVP